jgi:hypothetical protein
MNPLGGLKNVQTPGATRLSRDLRKPRHGAGHG